MPSNSFIFTVLCTPMVIGVLFSLETKPQSFSCRQYICKQRQLFYTLLEPEICLLNIGNFFTRYCQLSLYRSFMSIMMTRISQVSCRRLQLPLSIIWTHTSFQAGPTLAPAYGGIFAMMLHLCNVDTGPSMRSSNSTTVPRFSNTIHGCRQGTMPFPASITLMKQTIRLRRPPYFVCHH